MNAQILLEWVISKCPNFTGMGHQSKEYKDNKVIKRQLKKQQINIFTNNDPLGPIIQIRIRVFPSRDMK